MAQAVLAKPPHVATWHVPPSDGKIRRLYTPQKLDISHLAGGRTPKKERVFEMQPKDLSFVLLWKIDEHSLT